MWMLMGYDLRDCMILGKLRLIPIYRVSLRDEMSLAIKPVSFIDESQNRSAGKDGIVHSTFISISANRLPPGPLKRPRRR